MTDDRERSGDWKGDQWARGQSAAADGRAELEAEVNTDPAGGELDVETTTNAGEDRWNKTQWVGDQGEGAPMPVDPDTMPEGENRLSGERHSPGGEHFATGQADVRSRESGDRPLEQ
jgi:hypothetical protein